MPSLGLLDPEGEGLQSLKMLGSTRLTTQCTSQKTWICRLWLSFCSDVTFYHLLLYQPPHSYHLQINLCKNL
jgi:hypothetical protein